jgi:hypothetical protein
MIFKVAVPILHFLWMVAVVGVPWPGSGSGSESPIWTPGGGRGSQSIILPGPGVPPETHQPGLWLPGMGDPGEKR